MLPGEARRWRLVEDAVTTVLLTHAYEEIHLPLLEYTELFARGVGESTDIVEKEMYNLVDRDGDGLSLRPEGTAGCVRALQENGLLFNQTQRVFYRGSMFRYERPQLGRYRQFYQVGAEAFGFAGPDVDAELIHMCAQFWHALDVASAVRLEINTLGTPEARGAHRQALVDFLTPHEAELDEDSQRRLKTNPLRILDSKVEKTRDILTDAPVMQSYLDDESKAHFDELQERLTVLGVNFVVNEHLVRGLDYYNHTVFEWITDELGSQGTVCGGGRYDGLVEQLGGRPTPAAGFGMGIERLILLHEAVHQSNFEDRACDAYVCFANPEVEAYAWEFGKALRERGVGVRMHMGGGAFKKQLKRADGSGAVAAVIIGEQEMQEKKVTIKVLGSGDQNTVSWEQAVTDVMAAVQD